MVPTSRFRVISVLTKVVSSLSRMISALSRVVLVLNKVVSALSMTGIEALSGRAPLLVRC